MQTEPVRDSSAWTRAEMEADRRWEWWLSDGDKRAIDRVVRELRRQELTIDTVSRTHFTDEHLASVVRRFAWSTICTGPGFGMLRGLDIGSYSDEEVAMLFWGIGTMIGEPVSQNPMGHRLGHVHDLGKDVRDPNVRGYQTQARLDFHTDAGDIVGLLCLRRAKSGGESAVSSATTVYNTLLAERPEVLPALFAGYPYSFRGEAADFQKAATDRVPVFAEVDGDLSVFYVRDAIEKSQPLTGHAFTAEELAAMDAFDEVARRPENVCSMLLEPGDMQFCSNHTVLHARTAFEDHEEAHRRRHLLRLWVKVDGIRKLDPKQMGHDPVSGWSLREGILPAGMTMRDGKLIPRAQAA